MAKSKTQQALDLVDEGMAPFAAAHQVGIAPSTVYIAIKRRKASGRRCPCCNQALRPGFDVTATAIAKAEKDRIVSALRAKGETTATCSAMADAIEKMA